MSLLVLAILAGIIAGILFLLSVIFRTALLPLRLLFFSGDGEIEYLINMLARVSFRRQQLELSAENSPLRLRFFRRRQARIITLLQEREEWDTINKEDVDRRVTELMKTHTQNTF